MKTIIVRTLLIVLLGGGLSAAAFSQPQGEVTLHGELVDLIAFLTSPAAKDAEAIARSARGGNPLGFYDTQAKKLYVVATRELGKSANEVLLPYVGTRVFITGRVHSRHGVNLIIMSDVGKSIR